MLATIHEIEKTLRRVVAGCTATQPTPTTGGGVGSPTAWLGWYYRRVGEMQKADALRVWVEAQANPPRMASKQYPDHLIDPSYFPTWQERWGEIAIPLLLVPRQVSDPGVCPGFNLNPGMV